MGKGGLSVEGRNSLTALDEKHATKEGEMHEGAIYLIRAQALDWPKMDYCIEKAPTPKLLE